MTLDEIKTLIDAMGSSDLAEMEVAKGGWTLRLVRRSPSSPPPRRDPAPIPAAPRSPAAPKPSRGSVAPKRPAASPDVRAPLGGVVYLSSSPDVPPFVTVGQTVEAGTILCTVEAMKTFNEVRADRGGVVEAILVASGDEVETGQPLVRIG